MRPDSTSVRVQRRVSAKRHVAGTRLGLALLFACAASPAFAQAYPTRPVTLIVPFAAGGTSDVIARLAAEYMRAELGQNIVNENTAGAGGSTALTRAARANPDGYTIAIGNSGTNAAAYSIYKDIKYTSDDFVPIGLVAKTLPVIAVNAKFPARTLAELIAYAKKNPGKINMGHAGVGSSNYLICRAFIQASGVEVQLVSYRGAAPALNDAVSGQIDGVCDAAASVSGAIQGGTLTGLVISSPQRLKSLPDVPTSVEAGLPNFQQQGWNGLFAPKGTPQPVIAKLNAALRAAVANEAFARRMDDLGSLPATSEEMSPDYVRTLVPAEIEKFRKLLAEPN